MKKWVTISFALMLGVLCTGCLEYAILIKVNKEGAGRVTMRLCMSDQMTANVGAMEAMVTGMNQAQGASASGMDREAMIAQIRNSLIHSAQKMGEGVTFLSGRDITNAKGWPGYQAVFSFDDINKLKLGEVKMQEQSGSGTSASTSFGGDQEYGFSFTPGSPSVLELVSLSEPSPHRDPNADAENPMQDAMGPMIQMMAPMMAGMRMSAFVAVDGEVVETDATHLAGRTGNSVVIYDIEFDKLMTDPEISTYLANPAFLEMAEDKNIPGVRVHNLGRNIKIAFE